MAETGILHPEERVELVEGGFIDRLPICELLAIEASKAGSSISIAVDSNMIAFRTS